MGYHLLAQASKEVGMFVIEKSRAMESSSERGKTEYIPPIYPVVEIPVPVLDWKELRGEVIQNIIRHFRLNKPKEVSANSLRQGEKQ